MSLKEQILKAAAFDEARDLKAKTNGMVLSSYIRIRTGSQEEQKRLLPIIETLAEEIERLRGALIECNSLAKDKPEDPCIILVTARTLTANTEALKKIGIEVGNEGDVV